MQKIPSIEFMIEQINIGNPAAKTLARQNADVDFGYVKPPALFRSVMYFKTFRQSVRFCGRKSLIQ